METIDLARKEYASTKSEIVKTSLERVFGKHAFESSTDWLKLWEKFCKENNLHVKLPFEDAADAIQESTNAHFMLQYIVPIRNKGWVADWDNSDEYKYWPYFEMRSGFAFSLSGYASWYTYSNVSSRLCYSSEKLCRETVNEFLPIYKKYMNK